MQYNRLVIPIYQALGNLVDEQSAHEQTSTVVSLCIFSNRACIKYIKLLTTGVNFSKTCSDAPPWVDYTGSLARVTYFVGTLLVWDNRREEFQVELLSST